MRTSVNVHNYLQLADIQHEFFTLSGQAKSAKRTADLLGLDASFVAKTLLFLVDDEPVLVIIPGNQRADVDKIKQAMSGSAVELASVNTLFEITGYCVGATPPVALQTDTPTLMDRKLLKKDVIYTSGGDSNMILKVRARDLQKAANASIVDVCCGRSLGAPKKPVYDTI